MKCEDFLGGNDQQRSLNLADNRLVNLYPTTNDKGDVTAFYSTPGLLAYTSAASSFSGLYTASNGRAFAVSGTTFYEVTTGGTLTSRGTVTAATVSKMSDNGIELILVNGTDGWLFTFATNALKKISVLGADFTVTIASPAVFSTVAAHGLIAGDAIQLTTTTGSNTTSGVISLSSTIEMPLNTFSKGVISPDSNNLYIQTTFINGSNTYQYLRDPTTGNIYPLSPPTAPATTGSQTIITKSEATFTPDGLFGFVFAEIGGPGSVNYIVTYARDVSTGKLTYLSAIGVGDGYGFYGLSVYDDGVNGPYLYLTVQNSITQAISVLQYSYGRSTGTVSPLTPLVVSIATSNFTPFYGLNSSCIHPDGKHLYSIDYWNNKIYYFSRTAATGLLSAVTTITCGTHPLDIARSVDNNNIYVITQANGGSLEVYTRNTTTGALTLATTILCGNATSIVISVDDTSVYIGSSGTSIYEYDRNSSTGALTPMSTPIITLANSASGLYVSISPNGKSVYATGTYNSALSFHDMTIFTRQQSALNVGLPTGLDTLTTYYVIAAGLTANNFEVSLTSGGTAVNTSGVQAGIHTFHTLGNGFPNGAKTVSYIDGRFVVCQPSTQNFYVSDVLQGGTWNALNVQTADSNPDMIVGQITLHNELIVFCEQSGETFYDSGTYPSPFVRNVSGIFEVGCIAPYSIAKIDNSVMWLGKSNTGQGIIYRLNGYTPVRLSTYAIEYAIQNMTSITDAMAFTYQQEGHHFYVITFPTGNRTFVFDVNTGLWHERAGWNGSVLSRWAAKEYTYFDGKHLICDYSAGNIYSLDLGVYTDGVNPKKWIRSWRAPSSEMKRVVHKKLTLEAEVGVGAGTISNLGVVSSLNIDNVGTSGAPQDLWNINSIQSGTFADVCWNGSLFVAVGTNICSTSLDGLTWVSRTIPAGIYTGVSWNGSVFCAIGYTLGVGAFTSTSADGITWSSTHAISTGGVSYVTSGIEYSAGLFCAPIVIGTGFSYYPITFTSPDGINWTTRQGFGNVTSGSIAGISLANSLFILTVTLGSPISTQLLYTSTDGITFTQRFNAATGVQNSSCAWNGSIYVYMGTTVSLNNYLTSTDGITWTTRTTFPIAGGSQSVISSFGGKFLVATSSSNNAYTSTDGLNWTLASISGSVLQWRLIANNGVNYIVIPSTGGTAIRSYTGYSGSGTYAITFTGGGGAGAAGTYTISDTTGQLTAMTLTNSGANYTTAPALSFTFGGIAGAAGHAGMLYTQTFIPSGVTPTVSLKYSNDGGHTWSNDNWRDLSMGTIGQYAKRVYWYRLGMTTGQTRLYELSSTSPVKAALLATYIE